MLRRSHFTFLSLKLLKKAYVKVELKYTKLQDSVLVTWLWSLFAPFLFHLMRN